MLPLFLTIIASFAIATIIPQDPSYYSAGSNARTAVEEGSNWNNILADKAALASCLSLTDEKFAETAAWIFENVKSTRGSEAADFIKAAVDVSSIYCKLAAFMTSSTVSSFPGERIFRY
jgi:hypothetical protein